MPLGAPAVLGLQALQRRHRAKEPQALQAGLHDALESGLALPVPVGLVPAALLLLLLVVGLLLLHGSLVLAHSNGQRRPVVCGEGGVPRRQRRAQ
jgi:hypothetical protein